ncbi:hypothetical protein [Methylogaea oryzae]|uniref:hypothetical protein n=1 Tax=Methylogaea oryzae TaxID=1295382 RepID=UPI0012E27364|nr:hypothetical protein [Methylogaea oryzae]
MKNQKPWLGGTLKMAISFPHRQERALYAGRRIWFSAARRRRRARPGVRNSGGLILSPRQRAMGRGHEGDSQSGGKLAVYKKRTAITHPRQAPIGALNQLD